MLTARQLVEPVYRQVNEDSARRLGGGPWEAFASLIYEPSDMSDAEALQKGIEILTSIQDEPWAEFLHLEDLYIPALQSIPPDQIATTKTVTSQDLLWDPADALTRVVCPVLAFFGEDDVVQPTELSAARYRQHLTEGGNQDFEIVEIPGVGHDIDLSMPAYAGVMSDWLRGLFAG